MLVISSRINNDQIKDLIKGNYRILYQLINNEQVDILLMHHSAKDFSLKYNKPEISYILTKH